MNEVDISEKYLIEHFPTVFARLLLDHTTGENIYWATHDYEKLGTGYGFFDPITIEKIRTDQVIRPRVVKTLDEQRRRVKEKAEVFTPAWVCNKQNNCVDRAWFHGVHGQGNKKYFFNREVVKNHIQTWETKTEKLPFSKGRKSTHRWVDYVAQKRLELACGEGPYLASRYDVATGERIEVPNRIGILDRKLRVITENEPRPQMWLDRAKDALKATYGFEWQGDNLLLAREALLFSIIDHYNEAFKDEKKTIPVKTLESMAYFIACNLWQMDGLAYTLPGTGAYKQDLFRGYPSPHQKQEFQEKAQRDLAAFRSTNRPKSGIPAVIYDWNKHRDERKFLFLKLTQGEKQ